jgi:hypothetical protein
MVLLERWRAARQRERERVTAGLQPRSQLGLSVFQQFSGRKTAEPICQRIQWNPFSQSLLPINALQLVSFSYRGAAKLQPLVSCFRSSLCLYLLSCFLFLVSHVSIESSIILVLQSLPPPPPFFFPPHHQQQQKLP